MYSIIILISIFFIIKMTMYNIKNNYKYNKYIKYQYVPKSIYDYQFNKIDLLDKYNNLFSNNIDYVK